MFIRYIKLALTFFCLASILYIIELQLNCSEHTLLKIKYISITQEKIYVCLYIHTYIYTVYAVVYIYTHTYIHILYLFFIVIMSYCKPVQAYNNINGTINQMFVFDTTIHPQTQQQMLHGHWLGPLHLPPHCERSLEKPSVKVLFRSCTALV